MGKWIVEYTVDAGNVQKIEVEADDSLKASRVAEDKLKLRHPGGYVAVRDVIMRNSASFTNVKKGDRVSVKGAKKYDALSPDTVAGTVLFIHPDGKVAVQVGSGQMNVLPQDIVNSSPFANGRAKAEAYLNSRAEACGVRVENSKVVHVEKNRGGFVVYVDGKEVDYASNQTELHAILRDYDSMGYRFDRTKSRF